MNPDSDNTNSAVSGMIQSLDPAPSNQDIFQVPAPQQPQSPYQLPIAPQQPAQPQVFPQQQYQQPQNPQLPVGQQSEYPISGQPPLPTPPTDVGALVEQIQNLQQQVEQINSGSQPQQDSDWPDRPQTWGGLKQAIQTEAERISQSQIANLQRQQEQQAAAKQDAQKAADQAIDSAIGQLRQVGYLPPIVNSTDPNDAGKMAERELIGYTVAMGSNNLAAAAGPLRALHDSGYYYDTAQSKLVRRGSQTAAAQAPIAGGNPNIAAPQGGGLTARQLATMNLDQVMQMGLSQLGQ